ncbi:MULTISPECIES: L-histidine N(alpha)-methyltransferase [unclassified Beijerinckia]|uniref:L-histidine N(alpha)-methyltransferase n=1 Tax=unclassified Beijerinckia TaxID=2638183 RepID=UPI00089AB2B9|nr:MULTISPECIES: L-histidine N(alpha)-methyltransferase [unclassified Beijerinckia]MDH7796940.1 L-histidine N-alpha-methyltransferase [Beijerinckia sp. GAS462]SEC66011.1 dimethylhistidine N-methyltransferase [Beijerinckia sp. 28-YEA-48]
MTYSLKDRSITVTPDKMEFAADVIHGLSQPNKTLSCRWFYDAKGSDLFEQITELPEYYPTRTETRILQACAPAIAQRTQPGSILVEYGSGSSRKTEILLSALHDLAAYVPIDVSEAALDEATERLTAQMPHLDIFPVVGDFLAEIDLPAQLRQKPRLGFFPGSTIGNLTRDAAQGLLHTMGERLGPMSRLIVGVDLIKDPAILVPAYDDAAGVTADFNLNVLARINRELSGTFDLDAFAHRAIWNENQERIEMHLESRRHQTVRILDRTFDFAAGEHIHTENSHKYSLDGFTELARKAGFQTLERWTDESHLFSVHDLRFNPQ